MCSQLRSKCLSQPSNNNQSPPCISSQNIDVWAAPAYIPGDSPPHQPTNNTQPTSDTTHTNTMPLLITPNTHTTNRHSTPLLAPHHHSYHTPTNTINHGMRNNPSRTLYTHSQSLRPRIMGHHYPNRTHTPFTTLSLSPIIPPPTTNDLNDTRLL